MTTPALPARLTPFDRRVLLILALLGALTVVIALRGDQIGLRIVAVSPPAGAEGIVSQALIRIEFDQPLRLAPGQRVFDIEPPLSGTAVWEGSALIFRPLTPLQPDTLYTVTLPAGLTGRRGQALRDDFRWQFRTGRLRVVYLAPDAAGVYQLFLLDPLQPGAPPSQLTYETVGVWNFAPAPQGDWIAYAAQRSDGGNDLWAVAPTGGERRRLLACAQASCSGPVWAPAGDRLIYERSEMLAAEGGVGPPRLWWLHTAGGETAPVFDDSQWLGFGAAISPDGQWLSHVAPHKAAIFVYNLQDGRSLQAPTQLGEPAVWSPHSDLLLLTDMTAQEGGFVMHVLRLNVESGQIEDISESAQHGDSSPAWSPDGRQVMVERSAAADPASGQLWLLPAAGGQGRLLADQQGVSHSVLSWSPDGQSLLMQRTTRGEMAMAEVWLLDVTTGGLRRLATPGSWPRWLP